MWMTRARLGQGRALCMVLVSLAVGCEPKKEEPPAPEPEAVVCVPARSNERLPVRLASTRETSQETFDNLLVRVDAMCGSCHAAPASTGGFQYTSSHASLKAVGAQMAWQASQGAMPPLASAEQLKQAVALGRALSSWIEQGTPTGTFTVTEDTSLGEVTEVTPAVAEAMTDLGNCIPSEKGLGSDPDKDAYFASLTGLPRYLSETDTDIMTLDAEKLARHGTFAFAPTYQLFSDHAKKLRLVHVPAGKAIEYDRASGRFVIPPNTRFYKTFFKAVKDAQGKVSYRRIETRLIVTRARWQDAVFGTYVWNEAGTVAELHDMRYRDGSRFSDRVLVYRSDEATGATRNYAIPGRHRCIDCHTGSEGENFVLGFTPLQVNRRARGEGGVEPNVDVLEDELSQVDRLIRYGVIKGINSSAELPRLEASAGDRKPRNKEELELQAYMVGNCAQCHSPKGFAVVSNPAIAHLDFSAGGILFQFDTRLKESNGLKYYVNTQVSDFEADLKSRSPASTFYQRVAQDTTAEYIHMPANVPGNDCRLSLLVARWIGSLDWPADGSTPEQKEAARRERIRKAEAVVSATCQNPPDVRWIAEDFTDKVPYEPRNTAWKTSIGSGPFEYLTRYPITSQHAQLAHQRFPTNFWRPKPGCDFESRPRPATIERWMVDDLGEPIQPWGELYESTPGATVFQGICANCHGRAGDGQSGAAKTLVALNGARVANLVSGLFGRSSTGEGHYKMFDAELGEHGAARYLTWMAAGGTPVKFSEAFMQAWVKYGEVDIDFSSEPKDWERWGANMLGAARGACDLIRVGKFGTGSAEPNGGNILAIGGTTMWTRICTLDNPLTDAIREGTDTAATAEWLQRAQFNAGVMAYFYLRDELSQGRIYPLRSECDRR